MAARRAVTASASASASGQPSVMENATRGRSAYISKNFKSPVILLACSAAVLLASCSAGPPDSTPAESSSNPQPYISAPAPSTAAAPVPEASSTAAVGAEGSLLAEPALPDAIFAGSSEQEVVVSEKGTGAGTYPIGSGLAVGQLASASVSCTPGGEVTVTIDAGTDVVSQTSLCLSDGGLWMTLSAFTGETKDAEVRVETSEGVPFWVLAVVHQPDDETAGAGG